MAAIVRSACDVFTEITESNLPNVDPILILEFRKAEKEKNPEKCYVEVKYKLMPKMYEKMKEKAKGLEEKGFNIQAYGHGIDDKTRYVDILTPMKMETLLKLSKDGDIELIKKSDSYKKI